LGWREALCEQPGIKYSGAKVYETAWSGYVRLSAGLQTPLRPYNKLCAHCSAVPRFTGLGWPGAAARNRTATARRKEPPKGSEQRGRDTDAKIPVGHRRYPSPSHTSNRASNLTPSHTHTDPNLQQTEHTTRIDDPRDSALCN
jgi:hypothetical protein